MTSTNDGKDVKSNQTSVQKGKTYYIELYKTLDSRLSADTTGSERTNAVCEAWRRVHSLCQHSAPNTHPHLLAWLQRHTSFTILQNDWPKATDTSQLKEQHIWLEEAIDVFISECTEAKVQRGGVSPPWESQLLQRALWFKSTLSDPWSHPVLRTLLKSQENQLTDEEVLEWLKQERGLTFVTRLKQLAASRRCRELALRLAAAVMQRARAGAPLVPDVDQAADMQNSPKTADSAFMNILQREAGFKGEVWNLITDIEFVLLHSESQSRCIELAKQTPLHNCYNLVDRLQNRLDTSPRDKKIWKNAKEVATLIAQVVIARCMVIPTCTGAAALALYRNATALVRLLPAQQLPAAAAALAAPAPTAAHLHMLAVAVHAQCKDERKSFVCELYVRAITAGMNELERLKLKTEKEAEARYTEQTLSKWFTQLGSLLSASARLSCECFLTAFSVHSSQEMYEQVKNAPRLEPLLKDAQECKPETNSEFGSWANDSRTQTNLVKTSETLNMKSQKQANVLSTAIFAEGEALGLGADLCQDLAVLISGPRVKTLTWDMERESLLENCRTYMERTHSGTRALTTELKYLNLDPRSFQHLPEEDDDENDAYYGIEKGYEHLVERAEDNFEDEFMFEAEQTDIFQGTGEPVTDAPKKKNKSKPLQYSSDEEVDPLNLDDMKKSEKQERPHSKERRKEKHKLGKNTDESKEHSQEKIKEIQKKEKKKERKERKKKDKMAASEVGGSTQNLKGLSRLIGMKVERQEGDESAPVINLCAYDSDYDSQEKSSVNSEGNDPNVVFDGLYSMDEIKSPERSILTNNIGHNKTHSAPNLALSKSQVIVSRPNAPYQANSQVKKSIKKLLEFRKHKNSNSNTASTNFKPLSCPNHLKVSPLISQKSNSNEKWKLSLVSTSEHNDFVKSYGHHGNVADYKKVVNKPVEVFLPPTNTSQKANCSVTEGKKSLQYAPYPIKKVSQPIIKQSNASNINQSNPSQPIKASTLDTESSSQNQYKEFLKRRTSVVIKKQPTKSCSDTLSQIQFQEFLRQQSATQANNVDKLQVYTARQYQMKNLQNESQQSLSNSNMLSQVQSQNFVKELRESANAGTNKVVSSKSQQITKSIPKQQKKVDNAPNTFSRRNYLHKTKQNDNKIKVNQNLTKPALSISMEEMQKLGVDYNKVSNLQTKGEIVISRLEVKNKSSKPVSSKVDNSNCLSQQKSTSSVLKHPIMSHILSSNETYGVKLSSGNEIKNTDQRQIVVPNSNLSEKDQNDLLLLLRQQSKMNVKPTPKTEVENNTMCSNLKVSNIDTDLNNSNLSIVCQNLNTNLLSKQAITQSVEASVIKTNDNFTNTASEPKKSRNVKGNSKNQRQSSNNDNSTSDWESVMNALLAHKTPSRGPNALDVALKKDSFEKRHSNYTKTMAQCPVPSTISERSLFKHSATKLTSTNTSSLPKKENAQDFKPRSEKNVTKLVNTKESQIEISKRSVIKKCEKHISSVIQNGNDPFISGIPNSDFDLLGDLMDDDLRQEIGELLADDEAYGMPTITTKIKSLPNDLYFNVNKTNTTPIRKPQLIIDGRQTKNQRGSRISSSSSNHKEDLHIKSINANQNSKLRIISNELVTSPIVANNSNTRTRSNRHLNNVTKDRNANDHNPMVVNMNRNPVELVKRNDGVNFEIPPRPEKADIPKVEMSNLNVFDPTQVVLTVPPNAPNVMLISNEVIYNPYTIQPVNQNCTGFENNSYLTLNQNPSNVTLFGSPTYPVIFDGSVSVPIIQSVPTNITVVPNITLNTLSAPVNTNLEQQAFVNCDKLENPTYVNNEVFDTNVKTEHQIISQVSPSTNADTKEESSQDLPANHSTDESSEKNINKEQTHFLKDQSLPPPSPLVNLKEDFSNISSHMSLRRISETNNSDLNKIENESSTIQESKSISDDMLPNNEYTEQKRIQLKRMQILNRKIHHRCDNNPIALAYEPINMANIESEQKKIYYENESYRKNTDNIVDTESLLAKPNENDMLQTTNFVSSLKTRDNIISNVKNAKLDERISSVLDNSIEHNSKCRRILLRSSNNLVNNNVESISTVSYLKTSKLSKKNKLAKKAIKPDSLKFGLKKISKTKNIKSHKLIKLPLMHTSKDEENQDAKTDNDNVPFIDIEDQIPPSVIQNSSKEIIGKSPANNNTSKDQNQINNDSLKPCIIYKSNVAHFKNEPRDNKLSDKIADESIEESNIIDSILKSVGEPNVPISTNISNGFGKIRDDVTPEIDGDKNIKQNTPTTDIQKVKKSNFLKYEDKIIFDELPNNSNDPLIKCVRVKLPNGKSFKVTISGKLNVEMGEIFEEPTIKAMILKNINNNKKCTLNVKQVKVKSQAKASTVTHVQDVSHLKYSEQESETIDLVSDDEESNLETFHTEFGIYNCACIDKNVFLKHQVKLSQKCVVQLVSCKILKDISMSNLPENMLPEKEMQDCDEDCIFEDDSSKDVSNIVDKNDYCKNENEDNKDNIRLSENIDVLEDALNKINDHSEQVIKNNINKSKDAYIENFNISNEITHSNNDTCRMPINLQFINKECVLKIDRCDNLIEKLKVQRSHCFVNLVRCDNFFKSQSNANYSNTEASARSNDNETEYVSETSLQEILNDKLSREVHEISLSQEKSLKETSVQKIYLHSTEEASCAPVQEALVQGTSLQEASSQEESIQKTSLQVVSIQETYLNENPQEDASTKETSLHIGSLQRSESLSILNDFFNIDENKSERSSPSLIENFELPQILYNKQNYNLMKHTLEPDFECCAEWCMTKLIITDKRYIDDKLLSCDLYFTALSKSKFDDKSTDCESDVESNISADSVPVEQNQERCHNVHVPSLSKIIAKYFATNMEVIEKLIVDNRDDKIKSNSSPLKRKIEESSDWHSHKISKVDPGMPNSCKISESENQNNTFSCSNISNIIFLKDIDLVKSDEISSNESSLHKTVNYSECSITEPNITSSPQILKQYNKCNIESIGEVAMQTTEKEQGSLLKLEQKSEHLEPEKNLYTLCSHYKTKQTVKINYRSDDDEKHSTTDGNIDNIRLGNDNQSADSHDQNRNHPSIILSDITTLLGSKKNEVCKSDLKAQLGCTKNDPESTFVPVPVITTKDKIIPEKKIKEILIPDKNHSAIATSNVRNHNISVSDKIDAVVPVENIKDVNISINDEDLLSNFKKKCLAQTTREIVETHWKNNKDISNITTSFDKLDVYEEHIAAINKSNINLIGKREINLDDVMTNNNFTYDKEQNTSEIMDLKILHVQKDKTPQFRRDERNDMQKNGKKPAANQNAQSNIEIIDNKDELCSNTDNTENIVNDSLNSSQCISRNNKKQKNVTLVYKGDSRVILNGSIYEDPVIGTCYVFPIINRVTISDDVNIHDDVPVNGVETEGDKVFTIHNKVENEVNLESLKLNVIVPNNTYSKQKIHPNLSVRTRISRPNLKRKILEYDNKSYKKKYRKSKNIDSPKLTRTISDTAYGKEYKNLFNYWNSIKFSFSRPFHKDYIDVFDTLKCWPILKVHIDEEAKNECKHLLFIDDDIEKKKQFDPLRQTLAEEISSEYVEPQFTNDQINETNFSMGFGDGSDRVIQISEDGDKFSKFSAATLSDVKQCQPFLLSDNYEKCNELHESKLKQMETCNRFFSYINLRDKVRSFFKKTTLDLRYNWFLENNNKKKYLDFDNNGFDPYDIFSTDFIEPASIETLVNVVQVGQQLPVSAAAQNPVTCDPRVTQVTDASPQCSAENSPHENSQSPVKTEYTELTTADISVPLPQEYERQTELQESSKVPPHNENIPVEIEVSSEGKSNIHEQLSQTENDHNGNESDHLQVLVNKHIKDIEYSYDSNENTTTEEVQSNSEVSYDSMDKNEMETTQKQQNGTVEKTDQIAHAMSAAGITPSPEPVIDSEAQPSADMFSPKICQNTTSTLNHFTKTSSINAMMLQQALAQILPPPLNQVNSQESNQVGSSSSVGSQVLHIVQGKNANGNQITVVENSQNSVMSNSNTPVLHIVQNKTTNNNTSNTNNVQHTNTYSGLSLVDTGLQQGNNQLLHIVNTGSQKNNNTGQILKRVNLLTNLANVQGSTEQKMVQFVCKSADGKSIQLNAPHQRSMVLRLQPFESPSIQNNSKTPEGQDLSPTSNNNSNSANKDSMNGQHEIKSRSVYEENYAKFIQNSSNKTGPEKSTSLPKFNQAFGKQIFQDGNQKTSDINTNNSHLSSINNDPENSECQPNENNLNLEHISQISSPPLLLRKSPAPSTQAQSNIVQQIKQTIAPMMHGGVIYTRQIPVNIGGGQTINLITVPSTELVDDSNQKQQGDMKFINQSEVESPIIKIIPQNQNTQNSQNNDMASDESNNNHTSTTNENTQNFPAQHQPVLTQMRIKLPMLSKAPQMVSGARVVRPSFFQIQRNVIGGANQHVYQQLVLTAAPPLGQHTIRLPQTHTRQVKVASEGQSSSESQMSSSTLEQLREFDMVLEQVKERSTVQPNTNNNFCKLQTSSSDTTDSTSVTSTVTESTQQILYSIGTNQSLNVAYVNRKPTTSTAYVRSPDSSNAIDSPSSSTHSQIPHTATGESTSSEVSPQQNQPKAAKIGSKSKSRPKSSSHPPNSLKINTVPPKTSTQKPLEDEQTTQRILYILAEYKEQVENSPDKDKPAPRRRSNPPSNPSGSSKRKKSSSSSRRPGARDMSPVQGDDTCRTMGSEDSSCGTSQGDCTENCLEPHSPQDSPRKVVRKLTFENETPASTPPRQQPQRNVIVADGQTITVSRGTSGKPTTAVLMPANYILPVSMVKGGQQIAIVTNRGPKLLTVGGETGNALLLQRLIGPASLKPVLTRPGVRHVRLPTAALHNLQAFNFTTTTTVHPPENAASPAPAQTPPELIDSRASTSPWADRESQDVKPERASSPEGSEPWHLTADPNDYSYEETVRTENMDRTVLVVHKRDGHRQHRLAHVSAAALRHKYAILEHELRLQGTGFLQKSLSEECEDLGVDSPSASELFPEAELLFSSSPAHDPQQHSHTPQPTILNQSGIPQPDIDDQIATDHLLQSDIDDQQDLGVTLGLDEGIVTVSEDGMQATIALDQEEFARSHPNTTFHSEPSEETEVQPFTITGLKGRHITSTIFHAGRAPATVLVTAPQTTVISQANQENIHPSVKYANIDHIINSSHGNLNLTKFDNILTDSREVHLSHTASAIVHSTGNATQVIRRVCYEDDRRDARYLMDDDGLIAGDDAKMIAEDSSREATLESMADGDEDNSSPERHAELFWESNSASERSERGRHVDYNYSSDSEKCCKSPFDETNSTDSSGVGTHLRLDSVIKEARLIERAGSGSSDDHPPLRTYPAKRMYHHADDVERSLSGKTRAGFQEERDYRADSLEVRRRSSVRGVVKRGCHCCNGSPVPPRPKKPKKKPTIDFTN